ncbi:acyltransferase family protein [Granulosicoccus sp. 3-233]|uniref:acyltransferase family protein n=1 Tax=Granulosicoccus sp. 3-233 TaxID=3417969 RepID=UPI003D350D74
MENASSGPARQKLLRLEAVRGLAAFYVVMHHTLPHTYLVGGFNIGYFARFGQEAVILFFLLSGFVINYSYRLGKDKTFNRYFQNRFYRIYIPLFFAFIISYISFSYNAVSLQNIDLKTLVGNIFMLQDWAFARPNVIVDSYMDNGPLWSLSYEWWFYMLYFPIVNLRMSTTARDRIVFGTAIGFALLYLVLPQYFVRIGMYLAIWWAGVRLADAYLDGVIDDYKRHILPVCTLALIVVVLGVNVVLQRADGVRLLLGTHPIIEMRHFVFAFVALVGALIINRLSWAPFDIVTRPFLIFAPISYALYIVHVPLARNGEYLGFFNNVYAEWVGYLVVSLVVSYVIEIWIYPYLKARFTRGSKRAAMDPH